MPAKFSPVMAITAHVTCPESKARYAFRKNEATIVADNDAPYLRTLGGLFECDEFGKTIDPANDPTKLSDPKPLSKKSMVKSEPVVTTVQSDPVPEKTLKTVLAVKSEPKKELFEESQSEEVKSSSKAITQKVTGVEAYKGLSKSDLYAELDGRNIKYSKQLAIPKLVKLLVSDDLGDAVERIAPKPSPKQDG